MLVASAVVVYTIYSNQSQYALATSKAESIANEIVKAANTVYLYGQDTQLVVEADFPDTIQAINLQGNEVIFKIISPKGDISEIAKVSDVTFQSAGDIRTIPIISGRKKIIVKSFGSYVSVSVPCTDVGPICATPLTFTGCGAKGCSIQCINQVWSLKQQCTNSCVNPGICQ